MNLYFLGLVQGCKKGRRESVVHGYLPCGTHEGLFVDEDEFEVLKNGIEKLTYEPGLFMEFNIGNGTLFRLQMNQDNFSIVLWFEGYIYPFETKFTRNKSRNILYTLDRIEIDTMSFIKKKNWVKRMLIFIFYDTLI
jgi:hypothetical protein